MQRGIVGYPVHGSLTDLEDWQDTYEEAGREYTMAVDVKGTLPSFSPDLPSATFGMAYIEFSEEVEGWGVDDTGRITRQMEIQTASKATHFLALPAFGSCPGLVIAGNSAGTFVFGFMDKQPGYPTVEAAEIDLNRFRKAIDPLDEWKVGFANRPANAEKGTLYGEEIYADDKLGRQLENSRMNQYGVEIDVGGEILKVELTKSGYVAVLSPNEIHDAVFVELLVEHVLEHILAYDDPTEVDTSTTSHAEAKARSAGKSGGDGD